MKKQLSRITGQRGFTLIELMVTTGVVGITGAIMYTILYTGMILFAKNTAINMANQQARIAVMRMEQDLHASVSVPQMTDASRNALTGTAITGPAAGISFQLYSGGPFQVAQLAGQGGSTPTSNQGATTITIQTNGFTPVANQRLIIPNYGVEVNISSVSAGSTTSVLTLATALPVSVPSTTISGSGNPTPNVPCFITDRVAYVVLNNTLYYYPRQSTNQAPVAIANNITTPTPFSIPATLAGAPFSDAVSAINLSTSDAAYSNLNFKCANMFLNAKEPCRAQLCQFE